ncbi:hypothetical protein BGW80DRAFT_1561721, partial [Lactifluus volemus]
MESVPKSGLSLSSNRSLPLNSIFLLKYLSPRSAQRGTHRRARAYPILHHLQASDCTLPTQPDNPRCPLQRWQSPRVPHSPLPAPPRLVSAAALVHLPMPPLWLIGSALFYHSTSPFDAPTYATHHPVTLYAPMAKLSPTLPRKPPEQQSKSNSSLTLPALPSRGDWVAD